MRVPALFGLAVLFAGPAGCVRLHDQFALMPDGSGRMTLKYSLRADWSSLAKAVGQDGRKKDDPVRLFEDPRELEAWFQGCVAFTERAVEEGPEWHTFTLIAWFEDINKVVCGGGATAPIDRISFRYEPKGEGGELTVTRRRFDGKEAEVVEAWTEMARGLGKHGPLITTGLQMTATIVVPGPVAEAGGLYVKDGRKAAFTLDETLLQGLIDGKEEAKKKVVRYGAPARIAWTATEVSKVEQEFFKCDLAAAKEKWRKQRVELIRKVDARKAAEAAAQRGEAPR